MGSLGAIERRGRRDRASHCRHHLVSDKPGDPHAPRRHGNGAIGGAVTAALCRGRDARSVAHAGAACSLRDRLTGVCFSPEADALVGGIVIGIGVDALRHVRRPEQIALASLPLLFGLHQLTEALVWWGLRGDVATSVEHVAVWVYLLFAFAALPILVPLAVGLIERVSARRRAVLVFGVLGVAVASALTVAMFRGPIHAAIGDRSVVYTVGSVSHGGQLTALYVVATCGALLASSYRDIELLGVLNLIAIPVLMWLTISGFVSLWCFWAAIVSVVIALHLRRAAGTQLRPADDPERQPRRRR